MLMFSLKNDYSIGNNTQYNHKTLFKMAQNWLNTPFRFRGYSKKGCDCCGLVIGILYENNILDDDFINKYKQIKFGTNLSKIKNNTITDNVLKYFNITNNILNTDLLLIRTKNSPIHFMIYEKGKMQNEAKIIQTTTEIGKVFISNFNYKS